MYGTRSSTFHRSRIRIFKLCLEVVSVRSKITCISHGFCALGDLSLFNALPVDITLASLRYRLVLQWDLLPWHHDTSDFHPAVPVALCYGKGCLADPVIMFDTCSLRIEPSKSDKTKGLYIQVCHGKDDEARLSRPTCTLHSLVHRKAQKPSLRTIRQAPSPQITIQELGWFSDPADFSTLVKNVPIPLVQHSAQHEATGSHATAVFNAWIVNVLQELDQP
ncbi:hypothetical protein PMIN02_006509 [Paraphaeosphaeria minitans]